MRGIFVIPESKRPFTPSFVSSKALTSVRTATGATPFSLVYRMEVVLLFKVEIPSLRILVELGLEEVDWAQTHFDQISTCINTSLGSMVQQFSINLNKDIDKLTKTIIRPHFFQMQLLISLGS